MFDKMFECMMNYWKVKKSSRSKYVDGSSSWGWTGSMCFYSKCDDKMYNSDQSMLSSDKVSWCYGDITMKVVNMGWGWSIDLVVDLLSLYYGMMTFLMFLMCKYLEIMFMPKVILNYLVMMLCLSYMLYVCSMMYDSMKYYKEKNKKDGSKNFYKWSISNSMFNMMNFGMNMSMVMYMFDLNMEMFMNYNWLFMMMMMTRLMVNMNMILFSVYYLKMYGGTYLTYPWMFMMMMYIMGSVKPEWWWKLNSGKGLLQVLDSYVKFSMSKK